MEGLRLPLAVFAEQSIERFRPPRGRPRLHWPLEFPEVFVDERGEPQTHGGFDAVIGNPPYIRVQDIGRDVADYCRLRFETARGSFDAYVMFLERCLGLLSPQGRLGFIVPNKLFKLDYGERLRGLLSAAALVDEVLDFGASQVFTEATNYTCILVLDRSGIEELSYRRIRGTRHEVLAELAAPAAVPSQRFRTRELASEPWVLVPPDEAAVIRVASAGSERLDVATKAIFTGLQTGSDDIYVLEDRGVRGGLRIVYSRASDQEMELEPDLLHPLGSGEDTERYAFRPLTTHLLFPYVRERGVMRLLRERELEQLSRTAAYLREHENALRARERHKMDHAEWYGYTYPKSLGNHDLPKLGVAATVQRLEIAADLEGAVYFHNVRVNGILGTEGGPSLSTLLLLLNSRLLDWIFRRVSAHHANDYYAANKQFIKGLPIRMPAGSEGAELDAQGKRLHELASGIAKERGAFLRWLASTVGARRVDLLRRRDIAGYEAVSADRVLGALARMRARLDVDPRERAPRELIEREHRASVERLRSKLTYLAASERDADEAVFELYQLPKAMRAKVDTEYEKPME